MEQGHLESSDSITMRAILPAKASVAAKLDSGTVVWISFFKGPLIGYDKSNDRHFVAFSAAWFYNWAKSLAFDGQSLWFGSHCKEGPDVFPPTAIADWTPTSLSEAGPCPT